MNIFSTIILSLLATVGWSQEITHLQNLSVPEDYENVYTQLLYENDEASYFLIWIKKGVSMHKHNEHTEGIYVVDGTGLMTVGDQSFEIKKDDFFVIPKATFHALEVTSSIPVKVISVQMPRFNKEDRIFKNE